MDHGLSVFSLTEYLRVCRWYYQTTRQISNLHLVVDDQETATTISPLKGMIYALYIFTVYVPEEDRAPEEDKTTVALVV